MTASVIILKGSETVVVSPVATCVAVTENVKPVKSASLSAGGDKVGPKAKAAPCGKTALQTPVAGSNVPPTKDVSTVHDGSIPEMLTVN